MFITDDDDKFIKIFLRSSFFVAHLREFRGTEIEEWKKWHLKDYQM